MTECLGPQCAAMVLDWLKAQAAGSTDDDSSPAAPGTQGSALGRWFPTRRTRRRSRHRRELAGAIEHLHYAVFRRYSNQLTRAERSRLDNTIDNALFKIDRYLGRAEAVRGRSPRRRGARLARSRFATDVNGSSGRCDMARRADLKLAQLASLTPESFEEFVGELFEMLGLRGRAGRRLRRRRGRPSASPQ